MLGFSQLFALGYCFVVCVVARWLFLTVTQFWWKWERGSKPEIHYKKGSPFAERVVEACSTLNERYVPPLLWGRSGQIQTFLFGAIGHMPIASHQGQRYSIVLHDGSTVYYDVFQAQSDKLQCQGDYTIFVCPGIGNTIETDYVSAFVNYVVEEGFRVAVLNHMGGLKNERLTGTRMFTYGGTEDMAAVFEDLCARYPNTKFLGYGFSLGACILIRFLGEKKERQSKFLCAASLCQGYDPSIVVDYMYDWLNLRRLFNYLITKKQLGLVRRHSHVIFPSVRAGHQPSHPHQQHTSTLKHSLSTPHMTNGVTHPTIHKSTSFSGFRNNITHGEHDCNGFSLDPNKRAPPDEEKLWRCTSMSEIDEKYTRRVLGFESIIDLYKWVSCEKLMYEINTLPLLILNAMDDPLILEDCHEIPMNYKEHNPNALFVKTEHGGHLGFFEGGLIPNKVSWLDRMLVEFARASIELAENDKLNL